MTSRSRRRSCRRAAALLSVVGLQTSCGSGTEPREEGSYSADITGAVTASVEGMAAFTTSSDRWWVDMSPRRLGEGWSIFVVAPGARPEAGTTIGIGPLDTSQPLPQTHAIVDVIRDVGGRQFHFWSAIAGGITILTSSTSRVSGIFELTAEPFPPEASGPISVTGTFDAVYIERPFVSSVGTRSTAGRYPSPGAARP